MWLCVCILHVVFVPANGKTYQLHIEWFRTIVWMLPNSYIEFCTESFSMIVVISLGYMLTGWDLLRVSSACCRRHCRRRPAITKNNSSHNTHSNSAQYFTFYNLMVSHSKNDISPDFGFSSIVFWLVAGENHDSSFRIAREWVLYFNWDRSARVSVQMNFGLLFFCHSNVV